MKEKIRYFNIVQIVGNILLLISLIVMLITRSDFSFGLYWLSVPISLLGNVYFIGKWSKRGVNVDNKKSKEVARSLDDITSAFMVFYGLVYLGIIFAMEYCVKAMATNIYVALGFYLLTLVFELFIYVAVDKAYKDTKELISKTIKK